MKLFKCYLGDVLVQRIFVGTIRNKENCGRCTDKVENVIYYLETNMRHIITQTNFMKSNRIYYVLGILFKILFREKTRLN